jgi:spore germination protein KA
MNMLDKLSKKFFVKSKKNNQQQSKENTEEKIPKALADVKQRLKQEFELCDDFSIREIEFGKQKTKLAIMFIEGFTDKHVLSQNVIEPIIQYCDENKEI